MFEDPSSFEVPLHASSMVRRFTNYQKTSPISSENVWRYFLDGGYVFHEDLITYQVDLQKVQSLIRQKVVFATAWPQMDLPITWMYLVNSRQAKTHLSELSDFTQRAMERAYEYGDRFINSTAVANYIIQCERREWAMTTGKVPPDNSSGRQLTIEETSEVVAGLIFARESGKLEEIVSTGYRFMKPPIYCAWGDKMAQEIVRNLKRGNAGSGRREDYGGEKDHRKKSII